MEKQALFWIFVGIFTITAIITLLGITGVLKNIKEKYLNTLFTALILEVIAAIFLVFRGLDFTENRVDLAAMINDAGLNPPDKEEQYEKFIVQKLVTSSQIDDLEIEVGRLKNVLVEKNKEVESLKGSISEYDQNFYSNIIKLDNALYKIRGNAINISYKPVEKTKIYQHLINIFTDLGIVKEGDEVYNADESINKEAVRNIYKNFRASYGRPILDDTKVYIQSYDISRMVQRYLDYRKVTPQFQARIKNLED